MGDTVIVPFVAISGDFQRFSNLVDGGVIRHFATISILNSDYIVAVSKIVKGVSAGSIHHIIR